MNLTAKQTSELSAAIKTLQSILKGATSTNTQLNTDDIMAGGWYLNHPSMEHYKAFVAKGVPILWDTTAWDSARMFAEWYGGEVYPTGAPEESAVREITLVDGEFYYTGKVL